MGRGVGAVGKAIMLCRLQSSKGGRAAAACSSCAHTHSLRSRISRSKAGFRPGAGRQVQGALCACEAASVQRKQTRLYLRARAPDVRVPLLR